MDDTRNVMKLADVRANTPFAVDYTHKMSRAFVKHGTYYPTVAYVVAIKPCGCTGPTLGSVETVVLPDAPRSHKMPEAWRAVKHGYMLVQETKDRVALFLNGTRLYGRRIYGGSVEAMEQRLAWDHYWRAQRDAERPLKPDGRMHKTAKEAMERRPRMQSKLWAIFPEKPYRYGRGKPKPVGYVWGKDAAALALRNYWAAKNHVLDASAVFSDYGDTDEIVDNRPPDEDISSAAAVMAMQRG